MMKLQLLSILLICILVQFLACSEDTPTTPPIELTLQEKLQKALDDGIKKYNGKGVSVAIIMPDGEVWSGVSGISSGGVPVTTDMLFSAGSITKMFTACTILQLVEEGKIGLDDSLHEWLPIFPNVDDDITIKQLLNHTSGIFDLAENSDLMQSIVNEPNRIFTMEEVVQNYTLEPYFSKGTNWHYSSTGYLLLRMIIKKITDAEISTQYRNRFFQPLGMNKSYTAPEEVIENFAQAWLDLDGDGKYDKLPYLTSFYSTAGGGLFCTATDLVTWAHSLFQKRNVISASLYDKMIDFHSPCTGESILEGYGLGVENFSAELFNNLNVWGHGGDALGYAAACCYLPDYNICFAIMDNTQVGESMFVINDLLSIILDDNS